MSNFVSGFIKYYWYMIKHSTKNRVKPVQNMDNAPIYVEITFNSQRARYYPGFNIHASQWDKDSQQVMRKRNGKTYVNENGQTADTINAYLARVRVAVDTIFERYDYEHKTPHPQYLLDDIRAELDDTKKDVEQRKDIYCFYDQFMESKKSKSAARIKNYITRRNQLKEYGKMRYFEDFTIENLESFIHYLVYDKKFNNTYAIKTFTDIKVFLNWAANRGYNKHTEYLSFKPDLKGYSAIRDKNVFALTSDELMTLYELDIKQDYLRRVRDVFCFSAFTGLRYSDVHALNWNNVHENDIQFVTQKTTDALIVPLNDYSRALIEKYRPMRGVYPDDAVFPVISNQKSNQYLKELGKLAGFDRTEIHISFNGGKRIETPLHIYELMTTHMGRKTFVSTMARQGVPDYIIRKFTGHKDSRAMQPYMRIDEEQKREEMNKMNNISSRESVFDYAITDDERTALGIPERNQYEPIIKKDRNLGIMHIALLMQKRGDVVKSLEYVSKLPDAMKVQYMQTITNAK